MSPRILSAASRAKDGQPLSDVSILLIDDDELLRCALVKLLQRRGARVSSFSRAEPALAAARALQPSLVVIDLELPGMTGFEAATALASDATTSELPILALSGHDDPRTRDAALAAGAHGFLGKPCSIDELERVVARLARHHRSEPPHPDAPRPESQSAECRRTPPPSPFDGLLAALARAARA